MNILNKVAKGFQILAYRLTHYSLGTTFWWALDHGMRRITGAPIRRVSQILPQLHVGGQYKKRGWPRLARRGVTAVVNMRIEFDDRAAGIAPEKYLYLPTVDDAAPSLEQLAQGAAFIGDEIASGGGVYIHCGAGVGRAATTAVAYLVSTGLTAEQAWAAVRRVRPFVKPTPIQLAQIEEFAEAYHAGS
ncbi:MAG: dual specificity protein phosphatase family protein [Anaerolineae bacterium]|nr:dual specificity protein phosphatase family protein [Anaerolineae bacterium]